MSSYPIITKTKSLMIGHVFCVHRDLCSLGRAAAGPGVRPIHCQRDLSFDALAPRALFSSPARSGAARLAALVDWNGIVDRGAAGVRAGHAPDPAGSAGYTYTRSNLDASRHAASADTYAHPHPITNRHQHQ